jgi:hypothetical protein
MSLLVFEHQGKSNDLLRAKGVMILDTGVPLNVPSDELKVAHYIKFLFNGSIKPLLLAMVSKSKN